jgi:FkbM family methyltransferase
MNSSLRLMLANQFPSLGIIRRRLRALIDAKSSVRFSYSQQGEDTYIWQKLSEFDLGGSAYIDIGANHPSSLSNTYLLYRHGLHGIVVEPNIELLALHRSIRPRDVQVNVGCGRAPAVSGFQILATPVLSSFNATSGDTHNRTSGVRLLRTEYLPVLPLDLFSSILECEYFCVLSIDTEGSDYDVVLGACKTLEKSLFLCIEANTSDDEHQLIDLLRTYAFEFDKRLGCNLIFRNTSVFFDQYRKSF